MGRHQGRAIGQAADPGVFCSCSVLFQVHPHCKAPSTRRGSGLACAVVSDVDNLPHFSPFSLETSRLWRPSSSVFSQPAEPTITANFLECPQFIRVSREVALEKPFLRKHMVRLTASQFRAFKGKARGSTPSPGCAPRLSRFQDSSAGHLWLPAVQVGRACPP